MSYPFKRRTRVGAVALGLALFATACGGSTTATEDASSAPVESEAESATAGAAAGLPQLVADTVGGSQIDTNDLAGQDIVVWFWAPW